MAEYKLMLIAVKLMATCSLLLLLLLLLWPAAAGVTMHWLALAAAALGSETLK